MNERVEYTYAYFMHIINVWVSGVSPPPALPTFCWCLLPCRGSYILYIRPFLCTYDILHNDDIISAHQVYIQYLII